MRLGYRRDKEVIECNNGSYGQYCERVKEGIETEGETEKQSLNIMSGLK